MERTFKVGDRVTLKTKEDLLSTGKCFEDNYGGTTDLETGFTSVSFEELRRLKGCELEVTCLDDSKFFAIKVLYRSEYFNFPPYALDFLEEPKESKFEPGDKVRNVTGDVGTVCVVEEKRCLVKVDNRYKCYWGIERMKKYGLSDEAKERIADLTKEIFEIAKEAGVCDTYKDEGIINLISLMETKDCYKAVIGDSFDMETRVETYKEEK